MLCTGLHAESCSAAESSKLYNTFSILHSNLYRDLSNCMPERFLPVQELLVIE